jgi:hypothetical protein
MEMIKNQRAILKMKRNIFLMNFMVDYAKAVAWINL